MRDTTPPSRITVPADASIHLGWERELVPHVLRSAGDDLSSHRSGSDTKYLSPIDQPRISNRPGLLLTQQLGYSLSKIERDVSLEDQGLLTSYGIFGAPGSGKTHLFLYLLRQLLGYRGADPESKYGALILDPKASLMDDVREIVRASNVRRERDLVVLNHRELDNAGRSVNVIDCAVDEYALGDLLVLAARSAGITASENYWFLEWANLFGAALFLLKEFELVDEQFESHKADVITLKRLLDMFLLVREEVDENGKRHSVRGIQRLARSARAQLRSVESAEVRADAEIAINQIERFFSTKYVDTIMAFISRAYGPFQRSQYRRFSPPRQSRSAAIPFYDQIIDEGRIVLVSVSPSDPLTAKTLCTLVKSLFQQTVVQRKDRYLAGDLRNFHRPLLLACDEYAEIASEVPGQPMGDGRFFSLAREFGCMGLLATQSVNVLEATSLKENWRSVFSTFAAKIFMRLVDNETAREASDLAGTSDFYVTSRGHSQGKAGDGSNEQKSLQERQTLPTAITTQLLQRGDAVVIGSLDGGATPPRLCFLHVPDRKEQDAYLQRQTVAPAAAAGLSVGDADRPSSRRAGSIAEGKLDAPAPFTRSRADGKPPTQKQEPFVRFDEITRGREE